jgi:glycosyltransferase involved in cell wall biosynthesis
MRAGGVSVVQMPLNRVRKTRRLGEHLRLMRQFRGEVRRLRAVIRSTGAEVVVIGTLHNPQAAVAARMEGTPVVWQVVDSATPPLVRSAVMPGVRRMADAVVFGGAALEPLHLRGRPLRQPSFVVTPAVDTGLFRPSPQARAEVRAELGIPADAPIVGTVANVNPTKGIEYFVRSAAITAESLPDARHLVVGSVHSVHAGYLARIRDEQSALGLTDDQLRFVGDRSDVERYCAAMDLLMITSLPRSEGTTTTAMEAMACGVPVVASDVGAIAEVVEDGRTGYMVQPLDAEALSERAVEILGNEELAAQLGKAGRDRAVRHFDVRTAADSYVRVFEAAAAHREARRR